MSFSSVDTVRFLKFQTPTTLVLVCKRSKIQTKRFCHCVIPLIDAYRIASSEDPDQSPVYIGANEPRHENTGFLHMRKQRRRSAHREADQRLCFRYIASTIPLLPKSEISSL